MAYQVAYTDPTSASGIAAAYAQVLVTSLDMIAKTATGNFTVWRDKASHDAGKAPVDAFTRTVPATALVNTVQTQIDSLVTGGSIPQLVGATVVA